MYIIMVVFKLIIKSFADQAEQDIDSERGREDIISQALETYESRVVLARAMVEPIRAQLNYASIGRQLLNIQESASTPLARRYIEGEWRIYEERGIEMYTNESIAEELVEIVDPEIEKIRKMLLKWEMPEIRFLQGKL